MIETKNPAPLAGGEPGVRLLIELPDPITLPKYIRVIAALLEGRSFNRFEAERELHDHCLHSTVATIQALGMIIDRREETVAGYRGIPTRVMRYWLAPASYQRALAILHRALAPRTSASASGSSLSGNGVVTAIP